MTDEQAEKLSWQRVYALDTTGMSGQYIQMVTDAFLQIENTHEGQELFRDLQQATQGERVPVRLVNDQDTNRGLVTGLSTSRGGYYDSDNRTIHLNPALLESPLYPTSLAISHMLVHESDHAVRDEDVVRMDVAPTRGDLMTLTDDLEHGAQSRANRYFAELGHPPQDYHDEGHLKILHKNTHIAETDADGSMTTKTAAAAVTGSGQLAPFQGDNAGLARFLEGLARNGVTAETIQRFLDKAPEVNTPVEVVPPSVHQSGLNVMEAKQQEDIRDQVPLELEPLAKSKKVNIPGYEPQIASLRENLPSPPHFSPEPQTETVRPR